MQHIFAVEPVPTDPSPPLFMTMCVSVRYRYHRRHLLRLLLLKFFKVGIVMSRVVVLVFCDRDGDPRTTVPTYQEQRKNNHRSNTPYNTNHDPWGYYRSLPFYSNLLELSDCIRAITLVRRNCSLKYNMVDGHLYKDVASRSLPQGRVLFFVLMPLLSSERSIAKASVATITVAVAVTDTVSSLNRVHSGSSISTDSPNGVCY